MFSRLSRTKRVFFVLLVLFGLVLISISGYLAFRALQLPPQTGNVVYGVNVDMTAMVPGTPYTITTASGGNFFDLAAQLGINTLRITDIRWASRGLEFSRSDWSNVFNDAASHHMKVILLLIDNGKHSALEQAHTLLANYGLANASALWLIDLCNEPDVDSPQQMNELRDEATYVHQVAPSVPITIGGWKSQVAGHPRQFRYQDPADIPKFIDLIDIVSPHLYQFDKAFQRSITPRQWTQTYLTAVRQQARNKPILLEEFGIGNGLAPTTASTSTGGPELQKSVYQGVFQEVAAEHNQGVIGAVAWIFAPRPRFLHPPADSYAGDMTGWAIVLNRGQRLLPAAQEFSAVAHSQR